MVTGLASGAAGANGQWHAVVFALVFGACSLPSIFHVLTHPDLLRRRAHAGPLAEREPRQKLIISLVLLCLLTLILTLVLDESHAWSHVPAIVALFGDLLAGAGLLLVWLVLRANPFAASTVTVETGQVVISTGPYVHVRHPMYSGGLLLLLGTPLALGSWWGLVLVLPLIALIVWRLEGEEVYLSAQLPGYRDYCASVPYRLIPRVW
ncbi:MAG TPA: isoprenylcysteine carboxylmethyltransferase family protein [Ktedonobacterales bacterium]